MLQGQIQKNLQVVYSDQHQRLEASVYQLWVRKVHKGEDQPCIMQAQLPMWSSPRSTNHQVLKRSYRQQSLFKAENVPKMAHVVLSCKDLSEIRAKFKLSKFWKIQWPVGLPNLKIFTKYLKALKTLQLRSAVNPKLCKWTTSGLRVICLALHPTVVVWKAKIIMIGSLSELAKFEVHQSMLAKDQTVSEALSTRHQKKEKTMTLHSTQRSIATYWLRMLWSHHPWRLTRLARNTELRWSIGWLKLQLLSSVPNEHTSLQLRFLTSTCVHSKGVKSWRTEMSTVLA